MELQLLTGGVLLEGGQTVVVDITEEGVLTHAGPELAEEGLQLSEVTGGGGDDVVTAALGLRLRLVSVVVVVGPEPGLYPVSDGSHSVPSHVSLALWSGPDWPPLATVL